MKDLTQSRRSTIPLSTFFLHFEAASVYSKRFMFCN